MVGFTLSPPALYWPFGVFLTKEYLDFAHFLEMPPSVHMLVTHLTIAQTELEKAFS